MSEPMKEVSEESGDVEMKESTDLDIRKLAIKNLHIGSTSSISLVSDSTEGNQMVLQPRPTSDSTQAQSSKSLLAFVDEAQMNKPSGVGGSTTSKIDMAARIESNLDKIKQFKDKLAGSDKSTDEDKLEKELPSASTSETSASEKDSKPEKEIATASASKTNEIEESKRLAAKILSERLESLQGLLAAGNRLKDFMDRGNRIRYYRDPIIHTEDPLLNLSNKFKMLFRYWDVLYEELRVFLANTNDLINRVNQEIPTSLNDLVRYTDDQYDFLVFLRNMHNLLDKASKDEDLCWTFDDYAYRDALCPTNYYIFSLGTKVLAEYKVFFDFFEKIRETYGSERLINKTLV